MNSTEPLATIVTVTFNLIKGGREKTFRQCLGSVHNQTYKKIEHIIIDGASKDGTVDLIEEYADKGWIKYMSEPDKGIYDAMNKGVKMAKGKYIAFLNSDDFYHNKEGVKLSVKALEESGAEFSYAPVRMLNEDGSVLNCDHPHRFPKMTDVFFVMPFCHQTMFTKRDIMVTEKMFNSSFKSAGDYDFVIRLCLKNYNSIFIKNEFVTFRFGGLSDANRQQSIEEVAKSYFSNYNKLVPITKEECSKIYCTDYSNFPSFLAEKLKNFESYFDYEEFIEAKKLKLKKRLIRILHVDWFFLYFIRKYSKPTRADVLMTYDYFFKRKPESESVILGHLQQKTVGKLITVFKNSEEFKLRIDQKRSINSKNYYIKKLKKIIPQKLKPHLRIIYYILRFDKNI